jgi:hypothetical protein
MLSTSANAIAQRKLSTVKPGTSLLTRSTINPLITNEKRPKVTMVKGRAKIVITGLMKVLTSPSTTAITRVFTKLEIWTPGRIAAVI